MAITDAVKLKDKEIVIAVVRRFVLVHAPRIFAALFFVAAPFFFMVPLFGLRWRWLGLSIFALSLLIGLYLALRFFVIWYWNAFIITSLRIIDIDQRGLFDRIVSESTYDKIQDVSYRVKGFWSTLFRYGSLLVQTAGAQATLELDGVRHPKDVHHVISEAMAQYLAMQEDGRSGRVSALLNAAANLTEAEAKAFLVELQGAVNERGGDKPHLDDNDVEAFMEAQDQEDATA